MIISLLKSVHLKLATNSFYQLVINTLISQILKLLIVKCVHIIYIYILWVRILKVCKYLFIGNSLGNTCNECKKWFASAITLGRHKMWHHKSDVVYRFNCTKCPYATDKKTNFTGHSLVHQPDRSHWCYVCGNGFTTSSSLNKHLIIHNGENNSCLIWMKKYGYLAI